MIYSLEKASLNDASQPTGWESVTAMANKYPKENGIVDSVESEITSKTK